MSLPQFFLDSQVLGEVTDPTFVLELSPDDTKHLRVLRLSVGEHIAVVDAAQDYFECCIEQTEPEIIVSIASHETASSAPSYEVTLVQGLAKGEKMDTVVRHATEIGVSSFIPLVCDRSIVKLDGRKAEKRSDRWQAIARSAAMQSGRRSIPKVYAVSTLNETIELLSSFDSVIVCWEESREAGIASALSSLTPKDTTDTILARIAVVVGPEGGLTSEEVTAFMSGPFECSVVTLGPSILRTETAGIIAPALVIYELGGLQ